MRLANRKHQFRHDPRSNTQTPVNLNRSNTISTTTINRQQPEWTPATNPTTLPQTRRGATPTGLIVKGKQIFLNSCMESSETYFYKAKRGFKKCFIL